MNKLKIPTEAWAVVARCWRHQCGPMLVALRAQFPQYQFRLGKKVQSKVKDCEDHYEQPVEGLMPFPKPNRATDEVLKWSSAWLEAHG